MEVTISYWHLLYFCVQEVPGRLQCIGFYKILLTKILSDYNFAGTRTSGASSRRAGRADATRTISRSKRSLRRDDGPRAPHAVVLLRSKRTSKDDDEERDVTTRWRLALLAVAARPDAPVAREQE